MEISIKTRPPKLGSPWAMFSPQTTLQTPISAHKMLYFYPSNGPSRKQAPKRDQKKIKIKPPYRTVLHTNMTPPGAGSQPMMQ
jgi:hypothetical protein